MRTTLLRFSALAALLTACTQTQKISDPPPPPVAPTVTCSIENGAADVSPALAAITLTASEAIDPASVTSSNITLSAGTVEEVGFAVSADGLTITLTIPEEGLTEHAHYTLFVSGLQATAALGGLKMKAPLTVRFNTVGAPAIVRATDPHDMANGVRVSVEPTITFSEPVIDSTPSAIQLKLGANVVDADVTFDANGKVATIVPAARLKGNATYTVVIGDGLNDADDILPLAGTPKTVLTFTTESIPPVVREVMPLDSSSNIALNTSFTITFSRPMNHDSLVAPGNITLNAIALDSTQSQVAITVTPDANNQIVTVTPNSLLALGNTYLLEVTTGVKDDSDIALLNPYTFHYTTALPSPAVTTIDPADNVMTAPIDNASVVATFNVPMDASTFVGHFTVTETDSGTVVAGLAPIVTPTGFQARFIPAPDPFKPLTNYTVTLTADIKDTRGQSLAPFTSHFKTEQEPAPIVTNAGCQGILDPTMCPTQTEIAVSFSRIVSGVDGTSFTVSKGGTPVAGTVTANPDSASFVPGAAFDPNTTYDVRITTAVMNSAGIHMAQDFTWQFTTGSM